MAWTDYIFVPFISRQHGIQVSLNPQFCSYLLWFGLSISLYVFTTFGVNCLLWWNKLCNLFHLNWTSLDSVFQSKMLSKKSAKKGTCMNDELNTFVVIQSLFSPNEIFVRISVLLLKSDKNTKWRFYSLGGF